MNRQLQSVTLTNATLFETLGVLIDNLTVNRHFRTAETYTTALNSFRRFRDGEDLPLEHVTPELMARYETWMLGRGLSRNTTSFYMRILRAAFNQAVEMGVVPESHPFRHVYTGVDKTRKRAVSLATIRRIKELDLSSRPDLAFARDLFLFSFYTRGMSFVDMAYLRPGNLRHGYLEFARKKTGQKLRIKWEKSMQDIVNRYPPKPLGYLLPIITDPARDDRNQYRNVLGHVNAGLSEISRLLHIYPPITTYVARHSWASIAYANEVPLSVISEALGHDSERTTRIYLSTVTHDRVDRANTMIIRLLQGEDVRERGVKNL